MSLRDFVEETLNLNFEGEYQKDSYVVTLDNSNDFAKAFDDISNNKKLELLDSDTDSSKCTYIYTDGNYEVKVSALLNIDKYKIFVEER